MPAQEPRGRLGRLAGLLRKKPVSPELRRRRRTKASDILLAAGGVALGIASAYFPWHVYFNPEQYGIRAIEFSGSGGFGAPSSGTARTSDAPVPLTASDLPIMELDLFATGSTPEEGEDERPLGAPVVFDQPFPVHLIPYRVVHVANGRAMIEDDTGIFIVQRGSLLPDESRVASIEQRGGGWVVVTDAGRIMEVEE